MAPGFSTKTGVCTIGCVSVWAARRLALGLAIVAAVAPSSLPRAAEIPLHGDADVEVELGPPSQLPLFGPRYAPVTVDLYLPLGHKATLPNLTLLLRLARDNSDMRLLWHPVLGSETAERAAEAVFAAWRQSGASDRCFAFIEALARNPEWLAASLDAEASLVSAGQALGLSAGLLRRDLRRHARRAEIAELWQSERSAVRAPPEVWLNGHRLIGLLSEAQLGDELLHQRSRAYQALHTGTPLTQLYEHLQSKKAQSELEMRSLPLTGHGLRPLSASGSASSGGAGTTTLRLDFSGSPMRGPKVAPATLVFIGSPDVYSTYQLARTVHEVWSRHAESVRLVLKLVPSSESGRRMALLLMQLAESDPDAFWRAFDGILEQVTWRYFILRYAGLVDLLRRQHIDVSQLEAASKDPVKSDASRAALLRDWQEAQHLGLLNSLPAVLLNGRPVPGQPSVEPLDRRVENELMRGRLSRWLRPRR